MLDNTYYEFRLGFPFPTYTYYTNSLVAKTYSTNAKYIVSYTLTPTNTSVIANWETPEYTIGLLSIDVQIFTFGVGNGRLINHTNLNISQGVVAFYQQLPAFSTMTVFGCNDTDSDDCLEPYTLYCFLGLIIRDVPAENAIQETVCVDTLPGTPKFVFNITTSTSTLHNISVCTHGLTDYYGPIVRIDLLYVVLSSSNPVVSAMNGITSFNVTGVWYDVCVSLGGLVSGTTYNISAVAWTSAGYGPRTLSVTGSTPAGVVPVAAPPSIRVLTPAELSVVQWPSGYFVSWQPVDVASSELLRYEAFDTGRVARAPTGALIYNGSNTSFAIQSIVGTVKVRAVTVDGFGNWSSGTLAASVVGPKTNTASVIVIALASCLAVVIIAVVLVMIRRRYLKQKREKMRREEVRNQIPPPILVELEKLHHGEIKIPRDIPLSSLTFLSVVGSGAYGTVWKAVLDERKSTGLPEYIVAVKRTNADSPPQVEEDMKLEAALMAQLSHENIVGLIGQSIDEEGTLMLVLQFCEHGSLLDWLESAGPKDTDLLIAMACDIADGMAYLSSVGIVHRDLAARNVLVGSKYTCKVTDFGLAKELSTALLSPVGEDLPIRWTAPEALENQLFTTKSDVWSFAVVMFEIFSLGELPYSEFDIYTLVEKVNEGYRLPKPEHCPDACYEVMKACWEAEPERRVSFCDVLKQLQDVLDQMTSSSDETSGRSSSGQARILRMQKVTNAQPTPGSRAARAVAQTAPYHGVSTSLHARLSKPTVSSVYTKWPAATSKKGNVSGHAALFPVLRSALKTSRAPPPIEPPTSQEPRVLKFLSPLDVVDIPRDQLDEDKAPFGEATTSSTALESSSRTALDDELCDNSSSAPPVECSPEVQPSPSACARDATSAYTRLKSTQPVVTDNSPTPGVPATVSGDARLQFSDV